MTAARLLRVLPVVPIAIAMSTAIASATTEPPTPSTVPGSEEDFVATADDFTNVQDMEAVNGYFIANPLGHLDEALEVADSPTGGQFPVGTIVQLVPFEAMVKRAPGFSPQFGDWEFFELKVSAEGTEIVQRGGAEIVNQFGGSCSACHGQAEPQWDFICEDDHGCMPLPIDNEVIAAVQESDPRPRLEPVDSSAPPG